MSKQNSIERTEGHKDEMTISCGNGENMEEKHKPMDFELCDYDEGFSRLEASDIGWCGGM